jgi:hypothetical protein
MTALPGKFDPSKIPEDDRNFEPIPAGIYKMQVIESRLQDTSSGSGQILVLTLEVLEGQFKGRRIWDNLNIINANADAQRIAQRSLADLCELLGTGPIDNSEKLHFKPFNARVIIQQDKSGQYGPQNRVRYTQPNQPSGQQEQQSQQGGGFSGGGKPQQQRQQSKGGGGSGGNKPWNQPKGQQAQGNASKDMDDEIPF